MLMLTQKVMFSSDFEIVKIKKKHMSLFYPWGMHRVIKLSIVQIVIASDKRLWKVKQ